VSIVRLATSTPICTHEELAALEFEPDPNFVNFGKSPESMEHHEEALRTISITSRFAVSLLGKTKAELIESVRHFDEDRDDEANSMTFLSYLTAGREKLEALLDFVTAAEIRHACAMAVVYSDNKEKSPPIPKPSEQKRLGQRRKRKL
jgi:hypothetical protein